MMNWQEEVERKVEKILELISTQGDTGNSKGGSELISLVNDFHESYKFLYGKYDDLVGKKKKNARLREKMNGNVSDNGNSSDSDSSSSEDDDSSKNQEKSSYSYGYELGKENNSMQDYENLQKEADILKKRNLELEEEANLMLSKLREGEGLAAELSKKEAAFLMLEKELQTTKETIKALELEKESIKSELEFSNQQQTEINQMLKAIHEEKEAIVSKKCTAEKSIEELKSEKGLLEDWLTKLQNENVGLKKDFETASKQVVDLNEQVAIITEEKENLNSEYVTAMNKLGGLEKAFEDLKCEAGMNLASANEKSAENIKLLVENEQLKLKLVAADQQRDDLARDLATSKDKNSNLNSEMSSVRIQLQESQTIIESLRSDCELLKDAESKVLDINKKLREELRVKIEKINALSAKLAEAMDKAKLAQESIEALKVNLKSSKDEKSQMLIDFEDLKQGSEAAILKISELERMLELTYEDKRVLGDENQVLASERSSLLTRLIGAEKLEEELKMESNQLNEEVMKFRNEVETLKQELEMETRQIADLNVQLISSNEEKHTALSRLDDTEKLIEEQKNENGLLNEVIEKLQNDIADLKLELKAEVEHVTGLIRQVASTDEEKTMALNRLSDCETLVEKLKSERDLLNDQMVNLQNEIASLRLELETEVEKSSNLDGQLANTNDEKSIILHKLHETEKLVEEMRSERNLLNAEATTLQGEIAAMKQDLETHVTLVGDLRKQLSSTNEEKNALSLEITAVVGKLKLAEEVIEGLKNESSMNLKLANDKSSENAELVTEIEKLKLELDEAQSQRTDLSQKLATGKEEVSALNAKISVAESELQEANRTIEESIIDYELLKDVESNLVATVTDLSQQLKVKDDDMEALSSSYAESVDQNKGAQEQIGLLAVELEKSKQENSQLLNDNEVLKTDLESTNSREVELQRMLEALQEEKLELGKQNAAHMAKIEEVEKLANDLIKKTENELEKLREENSMRQQNLADLNNQNSDLESSLKGKDEELSALQKELADVKNEASCEIEAMSAHAEQLQLELDSLQRQKNELEEQIRTLADSLSESKLLMEKVESELKSKIAKQETVLSEQKEKIYQITEEHKLLADQFQESLEIAEAMEKELEAKAETVGRLEIAIKEQKGELEKLDENHKEALEKFRFSEAEKSNADKEIVWLNAQMETLEVQLRLLNQKLRIAETEVTERKKNDERHKKIVEKLQENRRQLEEQVVNLDAKVHMMENGFAQAKETLEKHFADYSVSYHNLEFAFNKNCEHIHSQLTTYSEELQKGKEKLRELNSRKQELEHANAELLVTVNHKEGIASMLKEEAGSLEARLSAKEKEEERLVKLADQYEKRASELSKRVKEKDEEMLFKDEEKREVIRQLCIQIQYHRENCDHLCQLLSAKSKKARR